jgi:pimeloyl-ACP methyl ester carboxylesterase
VSELRRILFLCQSKSLRFTIYRAGLTKHSLLVDTDGSAAFSYSEKGVKVNGKPSIVFVHGLSSNKETWLPIIKVDRKKLFSLINSLYVPVEYS